MSLDVYFHGSRDERKVALTFDDGPNPPRTDEVLDILAAAAARATFFVIGKGGRSIPTGARALVRAGYVVENHSDAHNYGVGDYDLSETVIANVTGKRSLFVRAHGFDYASCSLSVLAQLPTTRLVDADVNPADYARTDPERIVAGVLDHPDLGSGSIIDLHDGSEIDDAGQRLARPLPMIEALPAIIDGLKARGYSLVGLDEVELIEPRCWPDDMSEQMVISPTRHRLVLTTPH